MKTTGVIIARFQTPYLHQGHADLIEFVKKKHNKIVVVLGVGPVKGSTRNPLDFYTRERMLKKQFPELTILPLSDFRKDDVWSQKLDNLLSTTFPNEKFELYGSRDSFIPYYTGKFMVHEVPQTGDHSGTGLREKISDKVLATEDFRQGVIYAYYNLYPKVYATLDIALFKLNNTQLLLGRRILEGKWRLPGGFADPEDADFESAALRELHEECGQIEVASMHYEKSFKVDDWRYRNDIDKIITLMFSTELLFGEPIGSDDIDEVKFFSLTDVMTMHESGQIVEEHIPQIKFLLNKYNK